MPLRHTTMGRSLVLLLGFLLSMLLTPLTTAAAARQFVLVIDAGHGGKDAGAVGVLTKEKTINLNVALAFGKLVEQNCPDVKVVYTRKTDVFVTLQGRADIANRNKADLFVSIHTNAVATNKGGVSGAETYTLGMHRAAENLEVAKRENSVITQEANYKQVYHNFDPSRAESYIIFEFMQDHNMQQSVNFARHIQQQYGAQGRKNKGVHQAGFLVLRATSMPSVLTEVGFISHPEEEKFLHSPEGVQALAQSLYKAFRTYQKQHTYHEAAPEDTAPTPPTAALTEVAAETPAKAEKADNAPEMVHSAALQTAANAGGRADGLSASGLDMPVLPTSSNAAPLVAEVVPVATRPFRPTAAPAVQQPSPTPPPTVEKKTTPEKSAPAAATMASAAAPNKGRKNSAPQAETMPPTATKREKTAATAQEKPTAVEKPLPSVPKSAKAEKAEKTEKAAPSGKAEKAEKARLKGTKDTVAAPEATAADKGAPAAAPIFKVQILSSTLRLKTGDAALKGLTEVEHYQEGNTYKYTVGHSTDIDEIKRLRKTVADRFPEAFVVAFADGVRTDLHRAIQAAKGGKK